MDLSDFKYIVVGAGFYGSVIAERIAADLGAKVLIIDKRDHIGGNCFSRTDEETGIEYHEYGTHIFHTSNEKVWSYINRFTDFNNYLHQVLITYQNKIYQMPINLSTINAFYQTNLKPFELEEMLRKEIAKEKIAIPPKNLEQKALSMMGRPLYEALIRGYTLKQWGRDPKDLPCSIIERLPIRRNYDRNYYHSRWQGIPREGYAQMFRRLLRHKNITLKLKVDYFAIREKIPKNSLVIYSGPIDRYFDYRYGRLEWRSLRFEKETMKVEEYQGTAVMNYAERTVPYTRIHEPRYLHPERNYTKERTVIVREYPCQGDKLPPFYPLNDERNQKIADKYRAKARQTRNLIVGGRLGDYKYHDMHHVIGNALETYEKKIKNRSVAKHE
jgi:UDP-galactopyranose mutase